MKRVEVHIAEGETNRRLGTLEYDACFTKF